MHSPEFLPGEFLVRGVSVRLPECFSGFLCFRLVRRQDTLGVFVQVHLADGCVVGKLAGFPGVLERERGHAGRLNRLPVKLAKEGCAGNWLVRAVQAGSSWAVARTCCWRAGMKMLERFA